MIDKAKWQVMATYDALYKGQPIKADLTSLQAIAPEPCFFAPLPSCEFIMSKMKLEKGIFWLAGGSTGLGQEGLKGLGDAIEEQTGVAPPLEQDDSPFEYEGVSKRTSERSGLMA
jgi:hypothetical protein